MRRHLILPLLCAGAALATMVGLSTGGVGADGTTTRSAVTASTATVTTTSTAMIATAATATTVTASSSAVAGGASATSSAVRVSPPMRATTTSTVPAPGSTEGSASCPAAGHAAVIDRANQRAWLCTDGTADMKFPITTAVSQPKPGTYRVFAEDRVTTSTFGGHFSYLDNFVAFTRGANTGARIAFHAVPRNAAGAPYQPLDTVGTPEWFGESAGCIRVLPAQSQVIWDFLGAGDTVVVIS